MNRKTKILGAAALAVTASVGALAWWLGMQQGMGMAATPQAAAVAPADPSQWSIPQGEDATRRHIRAGLKAGDVDPVTGLRIQNYHDPMVPGKNFDAPGKSPFMDMMLVPRYAGSAGGEDASGVTVSSRIQQNLGLRTAPVVEGALASEVGAVGSVTWNERLQEIVSARAMGFVEKLHVRATLDRVAAGAPLVELHIPDWVAAQEEYLAVARMTGPGVDALRDAARARMRQAGMDEALIERVVHEGRVLARVTLTAPVGGVVSELMVREGATVMPGMPLMRLQGTGTVWAEGQVPESQAALLKPGVRVSATSPAAPGQTFEGRVQALLPEVEASTRTLKARLELANPGARLVPGMFVQMRFARPEREKTLLVPTDAVIHTGRRSVVMLAESGGGFRPVEVRTGLESGGQTEIAAGLTTGQRVVLSGQFLIDSEASLRGLEAKLNQQPEAAAAPAHRTGARIKAIDGDTVTLDHPPIASLKWPPMVMDFRLPLRAQRPRDLAPGDQVQVEFRMQDGDMPQITAIQRVAPAPSPGAAK
ncbi:efflux RND transporter periplasmic adaptor subunit [Sphaerotilus sp.]|uniref:efflux RND transporter periplasmic adaptor subunit n=1 Tax=Sphaerotilus sp. TaxID=2093942 RepID=UPI002ACD933B|nr:efflux RND transporter periplasmic adaptor subunit [Sphaerotilus sp.]MDZ7855779.1 efflux RND transporter periplasmic adaptor subunit [Sphaerotilus sp.]